METYRRRLLIGGCVLAPVSRTCAAGGNRTRMTFQSGDFKSPVSASSTTAAFSVLIRIAGKPGYLNPEFSETMRSEAESNRREGFCRPVPDHSAIGPSITASYEKTVFPVGNHCKRIRIGADRQQRISGESAFRWGGCDERSIVLMTSGIRRKSFRIVSRIPPL